MNTDRDLLQEPKFVSSKANCHENLKALTEADFPRGGGGESFEIQ